MGVGPDSIVGVMACRSLELMVGIMGILKAGGAYLPINPGYPASRISYILKDSGAGVLLVNKPCNEDVIFSGKVLDIGNELSKDDMEPLTETRGEGSSSNNLAYVIYTSGSTGEPKGAMIEHRSLVNFLYTMFNMYEGGISPEDRCLSISNISFDASVCEIFLPLVFGACLVLNEDSDYLDVVRLSEIITEKAITFTYIPPSLLMDLAMLLKKSGRRIMLDKLFVGAEPIKSKVLKEYLLLNPSMKILNGYGPTEATIVASFYLFDGTNSTDDFNVPIGKPIQNMQIYILDKNMQPVPVNVPGEIHIGGEGVCRGYLNLPDLTAERFIENPFFQGRMYKTGDLAKWLPDGNIKFIGREDNQVKIRGLRIEIGEIENQLLKIEKINEAVVMVKEDQEGNIFLCGYFTASENIAAREIKAFLSKVMPEFMIPRYFVQMEEMPLTLNGKVDKGLLPEPALEVKAAFEYTPPSNDIEEKLVKAWKEVLKVESIGVNDNIFDYEVDSLTIMRVLVNVLEYGWDISMQDFYVYLTIKDLAKKIMGNNPDTEKALNHEQKVIKLKESRELLRDLSLEEPKNIFVTGATGYLGMHIIESAILHTEADIYCLVRGKSFLSAKERLLEKLEFYFEDRYNGLVDERIFVVEGDISKERMGLDERVYRDLCAKIDLVIHGAALVKHFGDYDRFKDTNIYGTENMIAFCRESGAKLNYISTISISGDLFKQDRDDMEFSENDLYIGQSFDENVYIKSKFQAEKIIFKAAEKGLKASVFRVGNLTGRYSDGHFQSNIHENRFYNTLKFYIQLGMVSSGDLSRKVEFTPVDICAEAIVKLAKIRSNDGLRAYHLFNSNSLELKEVIDILNSLGCSIEMVEEEAFSCILEDAVKEDGKKELMLNVINDIYGSSRRVFEPSVNVTSEISNLFLERLNISWPRIQEDYIKKIYVYMNESGFLDMNCGVKA